MKKTQKKLGNKGFSLVELIVVIAIMAVLVGVLAPTLVRNIEKSRESTDMQTLDSIRNSVTTALSLENVNEALAKETTDPVIIDYSTIKTATSGLAGALKTEMSQDSTDSASFKSSSAKENVVKISISKAGAVEVYVNKKSATGKDVVEAKRMGTKMTTANSQETTTKASET